jgi:hypothetical protein
MDKRDLTTQQAQRCSPHTCAVGRRRDHIVAGIALVVLGIHKGVAAVGAAGCKRRVG